jgi:hypothetical protein
LRLGQFVEQGRCADLVTDLTGRHEEVQGATVRIGNGMEPFDKLRRALVFTSSLVRPIRRPRSPLMDGPPLNRAVVVSRQRAARRGAKAIEISVPGIDLGKHGCSVVGLDATGKVVVRPRMRRATVIAYSCGLPACAVAIEACGAHHMSRTLARQGPPVVTPSRPNSQVQTAHIHRHRLQEIDTNASASLSAKFGNDHGASDAKNNDDDQIF